MRLSDFYHIDFLGDFLLLVLWTVLPVALSALLYTWNNKSKTAKAHPLLCKIFYGVLFGGVAVLNTEFGFNVGGAVINVRDAAPLCAGFIFGPVSGIVAGLIGGIERWFCVYWNYASYTQVACSIATVFAGVYAAFLRKYFFDEKRPGCLMGCVTGALMEVLHMTAIYLTHMDYPEDALIVVRICMLPMILLNALSLTWAIWTVDRIDGYRKHRLARQEGDRAVKEKRLTPAERRAKRRISQQVQIGLFVAVGVAFCVSAVCFFFVQNNTVLRNTESSLSQGMYSLMYDIQDESDESTLKTARLVAAELNENPEADLAALCLRYEVSDIYVADENGVVVRSTGGNLGFDFHIDADLPDYEQQYACYLALLDGENGKTELAQPFDTVAEDSDVERKYAAVSLKDGGFVQIALNAERVEKDVAEQVRILTNNRVIGNSGFILATDGNLNMLSADSYLDGTPISEIIPDLDVWQAEDEMVIVHFYETEYYCKTSYIEGIVIVALAYMENVISSRDTSLYFMLFLLILVFAMLFLLTYLLVRQTVVEKLKHVNTRLEAIIGGDLDTVVDERSSEEFTLLSDDINSTVNTLKNYIAEAAGRIDRELAFASQIQQSQLPSVFPPYPDRKEFSLFAVMDAAKEVGGDFYDFFFVGEDRLAVLIADVSGKGIPAAMFMMNAKTTIKNLAERGLAVNDVLTAANDKLCANNEAGMFVTAWMGIIDLNTGHVSYANAGHNPPYILRNGTGAVQLKSRAGFVLAGMEGIRYREQSFDLLPGERLFLYTDGVTEAINPEEALYGEARLEEALNARRYLAADKLLPGIREDVATYAGKAEQADDITMLVLDYHGKPKELTVPATAEQQETVRVFLESNLESMGAKPKAATQILIAADELVSNIVKFAYPGTEGNMTVTLQAEDTLLKVKFTDRGIPFDPLQSPEPDTTLSAEERSIGGLGILIMKKTMDDAAYARVEDRNELTLRKDIWR